MALKGHHGPSCQEFVRVGTTVPIAAKGAMQAQNLTWTRPAFIIRTKPENKNALEDIMKKSLQSLRSPSCNTIKNCAVSDWDTETQECKRTRI